MTEQKNISSRAWIEMLTLAMIWGGSFLAVRVALDEIGPLSIVTHRVLWGALLLWIFVIVTRQPVPRDPRVWLAFLVMGCLNNAIPFSLIAWGQIHIQSGLASILNAATAIFGVLAAALFFADERISLRKAVGVCLGFAGVATAIGLDNLRSFDLRSAAQLAVIGATMSYALSGVWARKRLGGQPPVVAAAGMLTGSSLVMVPMAWTFEGALPVDLNGATVATIAYMALLSTAVAYLLYYRVLAMAGSGNLMLVTLLVAPFAIALGVLVRGEVLQPTALGGFGLLALGLLVLDGRIWRLLRGWGSQGKTP